MSTNLVTVIIPTYNRAHCIARAIDSAIAQTHQNLEVIVVDDGSTDETSQLMKHRYGSDSRVIYLRQQNRGVSVARNTGLRSATGSYVALLDSDDVWKPWKIDFQLRCLDTFPEAGMIWTDMEAFGPDGDAISPRYLRTMYANSYRWFPSVDTLFSRSEPVAAIWPVSPSFDISCRVYCGDISSEMVMGNLVHTSTVLMRRDRLDKVGLFDETLKYSGEDYDFHLRTCRAGPVAYADVASIEYRVGAADQLTRPEYGIHMAKNFLKTIEWAIADNKTPINLPTKLLKAVQAYAHAWIGKESLAAGDPKLARKHLVEGLRFGFFNAKTLALFALSCGPNFTYPLLRAVVRKAKKTVRLARDTSNPLLKLLHVTSQ